MTLDPELVDRVCRRANFACGYCGVTETDSGGALTVGHDHPRVHGGPDELDKVAFFRGASLRPVPPGESKNKDTRYLDIREDDEFDEAQMATWVKQAAALPGWIP